MVVLAVEIVDERVFVGCFCPLMVLLHGFPDKLLRMT